jgi:ribonuclease D
MHDARRDAMRLANCGVVLNGVLDTQLVAESAFRYPFIGMNPFLKRINLPPNPLKYSMEHQMSIENGGRFDNRPLEHENLLYAAYDVSCLIQARNWIWRKFSVSKIKKCNLPNFEYQMRFNIA